jgi:hypothetical protein
MDIVAATSEELVHLRDAQTYSEPPADPVLGKQCRLAMLSACVGASVIPTEGLS